MIPNDIQGLVQSKVHNKGSPIGYPN